MHIHPKVLDAIDDLIKRTASDREINRLRIYIKFDNPNNDLNLAFNNQGIKFLIIYSSKGNNLINAKDSFKEDIAEIDVGDDPIKELKYQLIKNEKSNESNQDRALREYDNNSFRTLLGTEFLKKIYKNYRELKKYSEKIYTITVNNNQCAICLDKLVDRNKMICGNALSSSKDKICGHLFHCVCINTWLKTSKTCPKCRSPFEKEELTFDNIILNVSSFGKINSYKSDLDYLKLL